MTQPTNHNKSLVLSFLGGLGAVGMLPEKTPDAIQVLTGIGAASITYAATQPGNENLRRIISIASGVFSNCALNLNLDKWWIGGGIAVATNWLLSPNLFSRATGRQPGIREPVGDGHVNRAGTIPGTGPTPVAGPPPVITQPRERVGDGHVNRAGTVLRAGLTPVQGPQPATQTRERVGDGHVNRAGTVLRAGLTPVQGPQPATQTREPVGRL